MDVLRPHPRLPLSLVIIGTCALLAGLIAAPVAAQAESLVVVASYDGVITPVAAEYLHDALLSAQDSGAQALIIRLNTPGGLDPSMRLIIKDIIGATIPVVVYVSPSSCFSKAGRSSATRSMIFSFRASRSVTETLLRTASSAQAMFRPRSEAIALR